MQTWSDGAALTISLVAFALLGLVVGLPLLVLRQAAANVVGLLESSFAVAPNEALVLSGVDEFSWHADVPPSVSAVSRKLEDVARHGAAPDAERPAKRSAKDIA